MKRFFGELLEFIFENLWTMMIIIYMIASMFDIADIAFGVKHTTDETRITIEKPMEKKIEDGPKPTF